MPSVCYGENSSYHLYNKQSRHNKMDVRYGKLLVYSSVGSFILCFTFRHSFHSNPSHKMAIHVAGSLFAPMTSVTDQTRAKHEGNFSATTEALNAVAVSSAGVSETHAVQYNALAVNTAAKATASNECYTEGNTRMVHAKAVADGSNYRTLYSPSSAYGPAGPNGATAPYVSPYVSGALHQL